MRRTPRHRRVTALGLGLVVAAGSITLGAPAAGADAVRSAQWYLGPLGVSQAWQTSKRQGVKIGIVDSGIDATAPDLRGAVVAGKDFSGGGSTKGGPIGVNSHGTEVASLAAGRGHASGAGIIGTAPRASLLSAAITAGANGPAGDGAPDAIRWLVKHGAEVINLSFDTATGLDALRSAVAYAQSKDVVVVAAAGNVGNGTFRLPAPANIPGVVAVTGIDKNLRRDPGSTVGQGTAVAAPFSTTATTPFSTKPYTGLPVASLDGRYDTGVGTSLSAPIVSGIVALIRAKHPDENAATVITRLIRSATPAGGSVPNATYGYGIVNAYKAITMSVAGTDTNPLGSVAPTTNSGSATAAPSAAQSTPPTTAGDTPPASGSSAANASSQSSSGIGAGTIAVVVVVIVALLAGAAWLVTRGRSAQWARRRPR